jgi:NADH-quinone oxidoreductase subunit N
MGTFDVTEISALSFCKCRFGFQLELFIDNRMFFKMAVPHFWAPDVYEGSPALTTALMSTLQSCSYRYLV